MLDGSFKPLKDVYIMKKINCDKKFTTRHDLANPYMDQPLEKRLKESKAINLKNNHKIIDLGNGYSRIEAIDKKKFIK